MQAGLLSGILFSCYLDTPTLVHVPIPPGTGNGPGNSLNDFIPTIGSNTPITQEKDPQSTTGYNMSSNHAPTITL